MSTFQWLRRHHCPCHNNNCYIQYQTCLFSPQPPYPTTNALNDNDIFMPYVGMVFHSDDVAFQHYSHFARNNGFSVRKARSRSIPHLGIYKRDFVCYRSGFNNNNNPSSSSHHIRKDRKSLRCGCLAKMYLSKQLIHGVSQWLVLHFSNVHNHELLEHDQVCLLPAYRKIQEPDQDRILLLFRASIPIHRIVKILQIEKGLHAAHLPFLERDIRNFIQNRKKNIQQSDALLLEESDRDRMELFQACKALKESDDNFIFDYKMGTTDKMELIAWTNKDALLSYSMFGDALLFETTFCSQTYGMTFGAFLGINNYGSITLFGCVLLPDDTPASYTLAFQTFLQFMNEKHPQTIITDLDSGLQDAIRTVFPSTRHVISIWYILSKLPYWFSHSLGTSYAEFRSQFDELYRMENAGQFKFEWNKMVVQFGLISDKHISLLFSCKELWVMSYIRGYFLAQMTTEAYAKHVDAYLNDLLNVPSCLRSFFQKVISALQISHATSVQGQAYQKIKSTHIRTCTPIEEHAQNILTPFAFSAFQNELVLSMQYAFSEIANGSCLVRHFKKTDEERIVLWMPGELVHCSCKEFESSGILCRHALRVFIAKNFFQLPEIYFPRRWQRVQHDHHAAHDSFDGWLQEFHDLTSTLFTESFLTRERLDFTRGEIKKELLRVLHEVRGMPSTDDVTSDMATGYMNQRLT